MTLGSVTAKNADLAACYGDNHAASWPNTVYLAGFHGDPTGAGTELTGAGGYDRVAISNTTANMGTPSAGSIANAADFELPVSTGAFSDDMDHWAYMDAASGGNLLDTGALGATVSVTITGQIVRFPAGSLVINA